MKIKPVITTVLGFAIAYAAYWYAIAYYAEGYLTKRLDRLQQLGVKLSYGSFATSGFPYRLQLSLGDASLRLQDGPDWIVAATDELRIMVMPWQWTEARFLAHDMQIEFGSSWADWLNFRAHVKSMEAGFSREDTESFRQAIDLHDMGILSSGVNIESASINLRRFEALNVPATDELFEPKMAEFALKFTGLGLPQAGTSASRNRFDELAATFEIHGDSWPRLNVRDLEKWRDAGGTLELANFAARTGGSIAVGEGSFSLDEKLRVIGACSLIVSEIDQFSRTLRAIGTGWAEALADSAERAPPGEDQQVISITVSNGAASAGTQVFEQFDPLIRPD